MKVIRPKGWGPWPTKEQWKAHNLWRYRGAGSDSAGYTIYSDWFEDNPQDDDEYLAVSEVGDPVDIVVGEAEEPVEESRWIAIDWNKHIIEVTAFTKEACLKALAEVAKEGVTYSIVPIGAEEKVTLGRSMVEVK